MRVACGGPCPAVLVAEWVRMEVGARGLAARALMCAVEAHGEVAVVPVWAGLTVWCEHVGDGVRIRWWAGEVCAETGFPVEFTLWSKTWREMPNDAVLAGRLVERAARWVAVDTWRFLAWQQTRQGRDGVDRWWLDRAGARLGLPAMSDQEWEDVLGWDWSSERWVDFTWRSA